MAVPSFLARERIVARPGFNRWLIPPAALAVHLCIGQAYATSVYKTALVEHFDASLTAIGIIFSIAIVMLGLSAAVFGTWVDRNGPRAAMFTAAVFWSVGFLVGSLGIATEQLWLLYLGYGVIGGIGLGIGYISPVSTLIKWFPDRPGPGHRHGDHGLRRRRADRLARCRRQLMSFYDPDYDPARPASVPSGERRRAALPDPRRWSTSSTCCSARSSSGCRPTDWKPEGFDPLDGEAEVPGHDRQRLRGQRDQDAAVLAAVDRAVLQRDRRHRHPRAGRADDPGLLPRGDGVPRRGRRRPPASSACCRCSTWAAGSSGRPPRTTSAASRST